MLKLTKIAAEQIKRLQGEEFKILRISVVGGGCSGLSYHMKFLDQEIDIDDTTDRLFSIEGVAFVIDKKSQLFLKGTELDFDDNLNGKGFVFKNPSAQSSCGCGMSFSV